jgi:hypothetical protein
VPGSTLPPLPDTVTLRARHSNPLHRSTRPRPRRGPHARGCGPRARSTSRPSACPSAPTGKTRSSRTRWSATRCTTGEWACRGRCSTGSVASRPTSPRGCSGTSRKQAADTRRQVNAQLIQQIAALGTSFAQIQHRHR